MRVLTPFTFRLAVCCRSLALRVGRVAEAAVVDRDATVLLTEVRHLLPPRHVVATRPVQEGDRLSLTIGFIVEIDTIELRQGHSSLLMFYYFLSQ